MGTRLRRCLKEPSKVILICCNVFLISIRHGKCACCNLEYVPDKYKNQIIYEVAVERVSWIFKFVHEHFKIKEM